MDFHLNGIIPKSMSFVQFYFVKIVHFYVSIYTQYLDVSARSIKSYIKEINHQHPDLIQSSNKGYSLRDPESLPSLDDTLSDGPVDIPTSSIERQVYIITKILNHENSVNAFDLSEELFVSYSTIQSELKNIRQQLAHYNLRLTSRNNTLTIHGTEQDKRALISHLLYEESNIDFMNLSSIKKLFPNLDIDSLRDNISTLFNEYQFFMNDYSLVSFLLHLAITINRLQRHKKATNTINHPIHLSEEIRVLSHALVKIVEQHYDIQFSSEEEYELALLLLSKSSNVDYKNLTSNNISDYVGNDIQELTQSIVTYLHDTYSIAFEQQQDFFLRFSLHLKNLLFRAKNNVFNKNPLADSIKIQNPLIYDMAVEVASIIQSKQHIQLNDDEIAYIAFHIGILIDNQRHQVQNIKTMMYCPDYYEQSYRLVDKLTAEFKYKLSIQNVVNDESELETAPNYDLLISTVPLNRTRSIPTVLISPFLTTKDRDAIKQKIEVIERSLKKELFHKKLSTLILPEIFSITNDFDSKEVVIHSMCHKLEQICYVSENFEDDILYREQLSSTAFEQFAIPHSITMNAKKTAISILLIPNGLLWGKHVVRLVMLLCFNPDGRTLFQEIFEPITAIFTNPVALNNILVSRSYEEFIDKIVQYYEG